jgi:hypothetical protein
VQGRLAILRDPSQPEHNELLAALHPAERARIYPYLERVAMPLGMVLYEPSDVLRHVYFPTDCIARQASIQPVVNDAGINREYLRCAARRSHNRSCEAAEARRDSL